MGKIFLGISLAALLLTACAPKDAAISKLSKTGQIETQTTAARSGFNAVKMQNVLDDPRRDKDRVRDGARHTAATMEFFDLSPSDNIVEILPGGGWYTRVLLPYVSPDGGWYGINYSPDLRRGIFNYMKLDVDEESMKEYAQWPQTYPETAMKNGPENAAVKGAFMFGLVPQSANGTMDAVIFIRGLHHLNRIDPKFLNEAIADSYAMLKPGGIVGVVQHRAKEDYSPATYDVSGHKGYMKQSYVIEMFKNGGFVLDGTSELNANPNDTADYNGGVWTLPPSLRGKDQGKKDFYRDIGESDRMTLRFRKPS